MITKSNRKSDAKITAIIAAATAALAASGAQAQTSAETLVAVEKIAGVVSSRLLDNGDVELTLDNGRVVRINAADVVNQNGVLSIEASALAQAGLSAEVAAAGGGDGGGSNLLLVGLGVAAAGGVAAAAGGGGGAAPAPQVINRPPAFTSAATATAAENTTTPVYTAAATDADTDPLTFSIVGGADASRFTINGSTGALTFAANPNFEAPTDANTDNRYEVIIGVSDGKVIVQQPVVVTVTNVNDVAPVITSIATVSVLENRTVAFTATATDPEGDPITFALSGADAGRFDINATTGVVTFRAAPDFEAPADVGANNVYDVVVTANDGRNSTTQNVAITVTNAINITGTAVADTLVGTAAVEEISGLAGNDRLDAAGGSDTVTTGLGSDAIVYRGNAFDGTDVSAVGRQIVGNEDFITDFNFATPITTIAVTSAATTAAVLNAAIAGNIYFNVHSTTFLGGEVRGQLALVSDQRVGGTGTVTFNSTLSGANEVPAVVTKANGIGTITFTVAPGGAVTYTSQIDVRDFDVARLTVSHLHQGATGANGPVVQDLLVNARANGHVAGSVEADRYEFNASDYALTSDVRFASLDANAAGATIAAGTNVVVLRNIDNDANTATPFNAASALAQVANLISTDGSGFIVYYNTALQQTRVLYSANLNDVNADVKVVSRHTDLTGQAAIDALANFTAANFDFNLSPAFTSAVTASVVENRTAAFTAVAADGDGTALTYALSGVDAGLFNINAATGVVTFRTAPDFEAPRDAGANNVYDVVVTASDGQNSTTQNVAITVTNAPNITGTAAADSLVGTAAVEELSGLAGNDRLDAAGGSDTVTTGLGSDTIVYRGNAFDGTDVSAAGRQIVGNEDFITDFNFATPVTTIAVTSAATTAAVLNAALAGNIYFNVHSTTFPGGEVRGQLALGSDQRVGGTGNVTFNSTLSGANEVPAVVTKANGVGTITFTVAANGSVSYTTQIDVRDFDVARLTVSHLHQGATGANGPVVQDLLVNARANGQISGQVEADRYEFNASDYGITGPLTVASLDGNAAGATIAAGTNVVVLRNADNDGNPATPFVAGTALAQVANLISTDGPGFVVYYNTVLQQTRVLYSANLNDVNADVKVVSRHTDLTGQAAIDALASFTAANFDLRGNTVTGTAAVDALNGTAASDTITGLGGADTITSGAGRDTIVYNATSLGSAPDALVDFDVAQDRFLFNATDFNVTGPLKVQNALAANLVSNGSNVIILRDSDNDANAATPFNARSAAQTIGTAITTDGAGFFVYFNSVLNLNRLVYSTNLNDGAAALTVLGAIGTTTGQAAITQLTQYGEANFAFGTVPAGAVAVAAQSSASSRSIKLTVDDADNLNIGSGGGALGDDIMSSDFGLGDTGFIVGSVQAVGGRDYNVDLVTLEMPDVPVITSIEGL